jgi:prepilin-type processing-associated H-X9-DG protein
MMFVDGLRRCSGGSYPDRYWPDWGGAVYSSDLGQPTGNGITFQPYVGVSGQFYANCNGGMGATPHGETINVSMCDGTVRSVRRGVAGNVIWQSLTPQGSEAFLGYD